MPGRVSDDPVQAELRLRACSTPEERARVKAVYITIDPERDTPQVMKDHLKRTSASMRSGSLAL